MKPSLAENIYRNWKKVFNLHKKNSIPILEQLHLTKVDASILFALYQQKPMAKAELAKQLSFESNSLTRSLDRLVLAGHVKREVDSADRRSILLSLQASGNKLAKLYTQQVIALWSDLLGELTAAEVLQLDKLLTKLSEKF